MDFEYSARTRELQKKLLAFMDEHIYPNESKFYAHVRSDRRWEVVPIIEELKPKARAAGLWQQPCSCRGRCWPIRCGPAGSRWRSRSGAWP